MAALNGIAIAEHLGRSIHDVIPNVAAGVEARLRQVIETGEPIVSGEIVTQVDFSAFRYDSPKLDFSTTFAPYFSVTRLGRVRIDFEFRWTYEVFSDFNLGIRFRDSFDSEPPDAAATKNDYTTTFSIGWSWN